jgi:hypothetical protein
MSQSRIVEVGIAIWREAHDAGDNLLGRIWTKLAEAVSKILRDSRSFALYERLLVDDAEVIVSVEITTGRGLAFFDKSGRHRGWHRVPAQIAGKRWIGS